MNILVTGGTGFIGKRLVEALIKKGHQVKVIARDRQKAKSLGKIGALVVFGDLGDLEFLKKELREVEVIYHLAAISDQRRGISWQQYQKVNVDYTKNLLVAAKQNKIKKFIFCSSIQAARPFNFYGKSKLAAERAVKKSGLSYVIIRPGVVYGAARQQSILKICNLVNKGFVPLISGGKNRLAIIFIDDLINLFLKCFHHKIKNKLFWGIGEQLSLEDLVNRTSQALGKPCLKVFLPASIAKIAAFFSPLATSDQIDFLQHDWYFKIPEGQKRLWQAKVKIEEGVRKLIGCYKIRSRKHENKEFP